MILSNQQILAAIKAGRIRIDELAGTDPLHAPFNTSAVDLRLSEILRVFSDENHISFDLRNSGIAQTLEKITKSKTLSEEQPYYLPKGELVLGQTFEKVGFPAVGVDDQICYSARVEGKSSLARCGLLVHFTAPTIHSGFTGVITLEIMNLGPAPLLLFPKMYICQLIIEEVRGTPSDSPNQFSNQNDPTGIRRTQTE